MNLETNDKILKVMKMLHSTNRQKDFEIEETFDWTGINETSMVWTKFYEIADLEKNGFIHPDGSLRFEYKVEKRNL